GHDDVVIDDRNGILCEQRDYVGIRCHCDIAADHCIGLSGREPYGAQHVGARRNANMGRDFAALLRKPDLIHHRGRAAIEMRRHAYDGAGGDDTGSADTTDDDIGGTSEIDLRGHHRGRRTITGRAFRGRATFDRDKARTEAIDAARVLIATRLVDPALAPELGFDGHDRDAIGLATAIATAFANKLVDEDALARVRHLATLAAPPLLGRADLIVDQD